MINKINFALFGLLLFSPKLIAQNSQIQELYRHDFPGQSIRALEVVSGDEIAFASDQGLFNLTKDGGKTWIKAYIPSKDQPYPVRSIAYFKDAYFVLSIDKPGILWSIDKDMQFNMLFKQDEDGVFFDALDVDSRGRLIAWGDPVSSTMNFKEFQFDQTKNRHFSSSDNSTMLPLSMSGEAAFAASDSNIKWVNGNIFAVSGGMISRFYKKTPNEEWLIRELPIVKEKATTGAYSMDFYDEQIGIVAGGDYLDKDIKSENIAFTSDGGLTWSAIEKENSPGYKSCIQYVPHQKGKAVLSVSVNGFHLSKDGGKTWIELGDFKGYFTFRFVDQHRFWAAGVEKAALFEITSD